MCTPGQTTPCFDVPAPGQLGNTSYNAFSGPNFFGQATGMLDTTRAGGVCARTGQWAVRGTF